MRKVLLILTILLGTIAANGQSLKGYELGTLVKVVEDWTTVGGVRGKITGNTTQETRSIGVSGDKDILYYVSFVGFYSGNDKAVSFVNGIIKHYKLDIKTKGNKGFRYKKGHVVYEVTVKELDLPDCYDVSFSMLDLEAKAENTKQKEKRYKESLENDY